jgi:Branched-chain amino acid transport system / permease component
LHLATVGLAALAYVFASAIGATQAGRLVTAVRDGENRVRFLGYSPAPYKILVFVIAGAFAGLAGALHTLHMGMISPAMVGVVPSIEMVVWVAVGGRTSLYGALVGTVAVNLAKDRISSDWPAAWPYLMGLVYIIVVIAMPRGLSGAVERLAARLRWWSDRAAVAASAPAISAAEVRRELRRCGAARRAVPRVRVGLCHQLLRDAKGPVHRPRLHRGRRRSGSEPVARRVAGGKATAWRRGAWATASSPTCG